MNTITREQLETEGTAGDLPYDTVHFSNDACYAFPGGSSLIRIALRSPLEAELAAFEGLLLGVSPDGGRLYLAGLERWGVFGWPGLTPIFVRPRTLPGLNREVGEGACVSWEPERIVVDAGERYDVLDFDGKVQGSFERPAPFSAWPLGGGLIANTAGELTLHHLGTGARLEIYPRGSLPVPRFPHRLARSSDGRSLHVLLGGVARRLSYEFDSPGSPAPARGHVSPDLATRLPWVQAVDRLVDGARAIWHPEAGALALHLSGDVELRSLHGTLLRLTGVRPRGWSSDGHALLVDRWTETGSRLEVWRTPAGRARVARGTS